jgi:hypothetical protein
MTVDARGWRHLYLSVPAGATVDPGGWATALARERSLRTGGATRILGPATILVGGAGPDGLGAELPALVRAAAGIPRDANPQEWTVEVDLPPRAITCAGAWRSGGVTRLSLRGPAADPVIVEALAARGPGLELGVELRLDVPFVRGTGDRVRSLIDAGASSLALVEPEEGRGDRERAWRDALGAAADRGWILTDLASAHAPDRPPRHARAIRSREPVLGLGPGAVTFRHPERRWNQRSFRSYLAAIEAASDPVAGSERLGRDEARLERLWSRLRGASGVPCRAPGVEPVVAWERLGWVRRRGARIVPTLDGWLEAERMAVELATRLPAGSGPRGRWGST